MEEQITERNTLCNKQNNREKNTCNNIKEKFIITYFKLLATGTSQMLLLVCYNYYLIKGTQIVQYE